LWLRPRVRILIFATDRSYTIDELRQLSPGHSDIALHPILEPKARQDVQNVVMPLVIESWHYPPLTVKYRVQLENIGSAPANDVVVSLGFRHGEKPSPIGRINMPHSERIEIIEAGGQGTSFVKLRVPSLLPNERQEVEIFAHSCDHLEVDGWDGNRRPIRNIYAWQTIFAVNKYPMKLTVTRGRGQF